MIHLYGYGNKMVEGIWGTILKVHKIKRSQNFSAYRALQPLSAMIFSHFLNTAIDACLVESQAIEL